MSYCGVRFMVIDRTGSIRKRDGHHRRGEEIKEWLSRHPEVTHYVVLDDDVYDMEDIKDHVVWVKDGWCTFDPEEGMWKDGKGLEEKHIEQAREILEKD